MKGVPVTSYLYTLLATALVAAVAELLLPRGGRTGGAVRLLGGLCLLVALITPLGEGLTLLRSVAEEGMEAALWEEVWEVGGEDLTPADPSALWGETLSALTEEAAVTAVKEHLESRFSIPPEGCRVAVTVTALPPTNDPEGIPLPTLTEVRVTLLGVYLTRDPYAIETALSARFGCEVRVE